MSRGAQSWAVLSMSSLIQVNELRTKYVVHRLQIVMANFADKLHVDWQAIDRAESAVLLSLIGGGLAICVLGAAVYDIGRAFSIW
jgi:hypothetical protein